MMNFCIPFNNIERISSKLTANSWVGYSRGGSNERTRGMIGRQLDGSQVELIVTLADSRITTSELIGLRVGDIITTDKDIHLPLDVAVEGANKFQATCGAFKGRKAIQVQAVIPPPQKTS
jgi:flagellar motor switch protein FliM